MHIIIIISILILVAILIMVKLRTGARFNKADRKANTTTSTTHDSERFSADRYNNLDELIIGNAEDLSQDWFEKITGFKETDYHETQSKLSIVDGKLISSESPYSSQLGQFEVVSLADLRWRMRRVKTRRTSYPISNIIDDVGQLHRNPRCYGSLFQVASQFNLLEMVRPKITPEHGVTRYQYDYTQGPACAIAAGAATIYRNYLVPIDGEIGQTAERQLNMLDDFEAALVTSMGHAEKNPLRMQNGYALPDADFIKAANQHISSLSETDKDALRATIKIGLHWETEVTAVNEAKPHLVSQAFCAAMPIAYSECHADEWGELARIVLEAAYESTFYAAAINNQERVVPNVYLTSLGGGAFGNPQEWITDAMDRAFALAKDYGLAVWLVKRPRS